jgi:hypothetical protein
LNGDKTKSPVGEEIELQMVGVCQRAAAAKQQRYNLRMKQGEFLQTVNSLIKNSVVVEARVLDYKPKTT